MRLPLLPLAFAACLAAAGAAQAALSGDEAKAHKQGIAAAFKADKQRCDTLKDNARDICLVEAKGRQKVAKAELDASRKGDARSDRKVRLAKAEAEYELAKERCDEFRGRQKRSCSKDAKAAHERATRQAKNEKPAMRARQS